MTCPRSDDDIPLASMSPSAVNTPSSRTSTIAWSGTAPDVSGRDTTVQSNVSSPSMDDALSSHRRRRSNSLLHLGANGSGKQATRLPRSKTDGIVENSDEEWGSISDGDSGISDKDVGVDYDRVEEEGLEDDEETGLTGTERSRRQRRKRRNTQPSDRIAGDTKIPRTEEEAASQSFMRDSLINIVLICLWYLFSISISVYNKWMFSSSKKRKHKILPFPLFITSFHMVVQFILASTVLYLMPRFRPKSRPSASRTGSPTQAHPEMAGSKQPIMTKFFYFTRIGPCGIATGLDIGLGNMSLKMITLTFYTMCKSSVLGFVLLFAFLFKLEKPSWKLGGIILTMTIGVVMMVAGETAFDVLGFILIMSSSIAAGFRWSLTQILLLRHPATSNPFSSLFFLTPVMFLAMITLAFPVEGWDNFVQGVGKLVDMKGGFISFLAMLFPGCLAFMMTSAEFALLKRTSVVTLSICGIFKEVITISAASIVFDDQLTPINLSGLFITIGSIAAYNYIKITKMRDDARFQARQGVEEYAPVATAEPDEQGGPGSPPRIITAESRTQTLPVLVDTPIRPSPTKRPEDVD